MCYSISYFQRYIFTLCVVHSYLFGGGPGRRRTCEQRCRRRKSRRTSPAHPAEAEWGSAPGCSSPDPTQDNECQPLLSFLMWALLKTIIFLLLKNLDITWTKTFVVFIGKAYRLSEVALSCYIIQTQTYTGLMQPDWICRENRNEKHSVTCVHWARRSFAPCEKSRAKCRSRPFLMT